MAHDLITAGRFGVDPHPLRTGLVPSRVPSFGAFPGGSAVTAGAVT